MSKRAIGYVRVSTEEQAQDGVSIDAQTEKLRQYAELYDIELVEIRSDAGLSAKTLSRPGLQSALDALEAGEADALLIYKLDRLTRSVADLGRLIETHFQRHQLLSVTDHIDTSTANGRLILNVLGSVSQWERETVVERTETALRYLKDQRRVYNHVPLGYSAVDGFLTPDDEEQLVISEIQGLRSKGRSLRAIADELNARGIVGKRGGVFYASTIKAILGNSLHAVA
jgi:DNA invertase Pin-like site-specific DNA recombinase